MPKATANGLQIEYETMGDTGAPKVLLIMGLGAQLTRWPEAFCRGLADGGFQVIRFDNRDVGLSTTMSGRPALGRLSLGALLGLPGAPPYTLHDMAHDAVGLLDALAIERAHLIGASMGGMIGQIVSALFSERVDRFVSIMSTSGNPRLPGPRLSLRVQLLRPFPQREDREARVQHTMSILQHIGSPVYRRDPKELRAQVERDLARADNIPGYKRQLAAIIGSPNRLQLLPRIKAPTLVVHGTADPLVPVAAAYDLHARIPGAALEIVPGMAHDLPAPLLPRVLARILAHLQGPV
jgi:pimeloyl-ACP methyl ester carboxylesterase